ncbi:MAG: nuclear transport factor 2 family protein [Sphingobium sp.]
MTATGRIFRAAAAAALVLLPVSGMAAQADTPAAEPVPAHGPELSGLERLTAMEEVKDLRLTFCRALDSHDWTTLRSTMTDDVELHTADASGKTDIVFDKKGIDEAMAFMQQILSHGDTDHICVMPQFQFITADQARALWFIDGYGDMNGKVILGFERIVEDYVRVGGKWRIKKADARMQAMVSLPK